MAVLESLFNQTIEMLAPGCTAVVITYHSLEDRMVKRFFRSGNVEGELTKDLYGNVKSPFKEITKKPILPSTKEIRINQKARSAKLRIAKRTKFSAVFSSEAAA